MAGSRWARQTGKELCEPPKLRVQQARKVVGRPLSRSGEMKANTEKAQESPEWELGIMPRQQSCILLMVLGQRPGCTPTRLYPNISSD